MLSVAKYPGAIAFTFTPWGAHSFASARTSPATPDFDHAVRLLAEGKIPVDALVTDVVPLAETAAAFEALDAGRAMKILVDCAGDAG